MLRKTARTSDPQNFDSPMIDHETVKPVSLDEPWSFKTKILWIRPTDLSWHYPILVTIRELPFIN